MSEVQRKKSRNKKDKQDKMMAAQLEKEDEKRMKAIENDETPPELKPSAGGPVIEGVPVENVSLSGIGEENFSTDEQPETFDSLQLQDNLDDPELDQIYEGELVQMHLTNQHKLERMIRYDH